MVMIFDTTRPLRYVRDYQRADSGRHLQHRGQRLDYSYDTDSQVTQIVSNTYYLRLITTPQTQIS